MIAKRSMEKVSAFPPDVKRIQASSKIDSSNADNDRPLKLIGSGEYDCCSVRDELSNILEGGLNCRKGASGALFDFLEGYQHHANMQRTPCFVCGKTYILHNVLSTKIKSPEPHSTERYSNRKSRP
jgi:hypothetical protein